MGKSPGCPSRAGFGTGAGKIATGDGLFIVSLAKRANGKELLVLLSEGPVLKELILMEGRPSEQLASPPFTLEVNRGNPLEVKLRRAESVFLLGDNLGASGLGNSNDVAQGALGIV